MARLIIVISGRRGSGKNTCANMLAKVWLTRCNEVGYCPSTISNVSIEDTKLAFEERENDEHGHQQIVKRLVSLETGVGGEPDIARYNFRVHAFATPLKLFVMNMGIPHQFLFGSDSDKNRFTHILWDHLPLAVRIANRRFWWTLPRRGPMTAREVMQVFGTDIMRRWYNEIWVRAAIQYAVASPQEVVVVADGRFPNEVDYALHCRRLINHTGSLPDRLAFMDEHSLFHGLIDSACVIKTVRLKRQTTDDRHASESAMDDYPLYKFDQIIERHDTLLQMEEKMGVAMTGWMHEAKLY